MIRNIEITKKNIIDTISFKEPEKVPVGVDIVGWALGYAKSNFKDVEHDPVQCVEKYKKIFDELPIDFTLNTDYPGVAYQTLEKMGSNAYGLSEDGTAITHRQAELEYFGPEVYDQIEKDYDTFWNDTLWKWRYPALRMKEEDAYAAVLESLEEMKYISKTNQLIAEYFKENGIYHFCDTPYMFSSPFGKIFDKIRGIKNSLSDLRRMPDKVKTACDIIWEYSRPARVIDSSDICNPLPFIMTIAHPECFLSPKFFDEYFWKYFVDYVGPALEAGKKYFLFGEGSLMHIYDRFREYPKGSVIIMPDTDDVFEVHKKIGDWATIMCGAPTDLMATGTKEQCTDYVKKCFDVIAPGGGFIFSTNREIVGYQDAKPENLLAVFELADRLSQEGR